MCSAKAVGFSAPIVFMGRPRTVDVAEKARGKRTFYSEYDEITLPEDIPGLGAKKGDVGTIRNLDFRSDNHVVALVRVPFSTGQTRGRVEMGILPEEKALAFDPV